MKYDVVIVGAGPAGLSCAEICSKNGLRTLIIERKVILGKKVCAGGITWNGLLRKVEDISQKKFSTQHIFTQLQHATVSEKDPIIATVNREELGKLMAAKAINCGAEIKLGWQVTKIGNDTITIKNKKQGHCEVLKYSHLVGADGSTSTVRKYLQLPVQRYGVGINYQISGCYDNMEWHLTSKLFRSGYAWIFPHKDTISIGAYADAKVITALELKKNLLIWAKTVGFELEKENAQAEVINFDYQGSIFTNIYLAGDAAGLASGLTGEGIYPAIISGEYIGNKIIDPSHSSIEFDRLIKNHQRHRRAVSIAGKNGAVSTLLSEITCLFLRLKLLNFKAAEMAR